MKLENNSKWSNFYLVFVFVVLYAPIFYLIFYSFNSAGSMNGFESFTLDHYKAVLADTRLIGIVLDTLILALLSSLIATINTTPIVEPIPQFCVTKKCCSTAVPSVITRFPPIKRVNMKSESDGINTACTPLRTPFIDNGTMTRLNVSHFVAPRSRLAAMSEPGNSSIELKIGKIIKW